MNSVEQIRVLCVDDHPLVRKGVASILANETDMLLVAEASNGREAVELFRLHKPDVTLMDLRLPELSGIAATKEIRLEFPGARIIALTSFDGDQEIYQALEAGARGSSIATRASDNPGSFRYARHDRPIDGTDLHG